MCCMIRLVLKSGLILCISTGLEKRPSEDGLLMTDETGSRFFQDIDNLTADLMPRP